jgi:hypothetical protein
MNPQKKPQVEKLLSQMALQEPSEQLDNKVLEMTCQQPLSNPKVGMAIGFGWLSLTLTALVSVLVGTGLGWRISASLTTGSADVNSFVGSSDGPVDGRNDGLLGRVSDISPLYGQESQISDEGFVLHDQMGPARIYRLHKSRGLSRKQSLPIRETAVIPMPEI